MRNGLLLGLGLLIVGCGGGSTAHAGSGLDAGGGVAIASRYPITRRLDRVATSNVRPPYSMRC